jgi:hypothetical protein
MVKEPVSKSRIKIHGPLIRVTGFATDGPSFTDRSPDDSYPTFTTKDLSAGRKGLDRRRRLTESAEVWRALKSAASAERMGVSRCCEVQGHHAASPDGYASSSPHISSPAFDGVLRIPSSFQQTESQQPGVRAMLTAAERVVLRKFEMPPEPAAPWSA